MIKKGCRLHRSRKSVLKLNFVVFCFLLKSVNKKITKTASTTASLKFYQSASAAASTSTSAPEMVLHMLDSLVSAHEPVYADYPSYEESAGLTQNHHQSHHHLQQQHQHRSGADDVSGQFLSGRAAKLR